MGLSATRTVEIGFSSTPGTAIGSTTWTDVTADVREVTTHRGRQRALDQFAAGTCQVTLNNRVRRYDPQYSGAGAPYNGNILPMRRIRVRATYNAVTYDLFSGFIDGWEQIYDPPRESVAVVSATDAFKVLTNIDLDSVYAEEVQAAGPMMWWRMAGNDTTGVVNTDGEFPLLPIGTAQPDWNAPSLVALDSNTAVSFSAATIGLQNVFPEGTWPFATAGTVSFLYRYVAGADMGNVMFSAASLAATGVRYGFDVLLQLILGRVEVLMTTDGGFFSAQTTGVNLKDGLIHHVVITWAPAADILIYVDGVDRTDPISDTLGGSLADVTSKWIAVVNAGDYPPYIANGQLPTWDELALFSTALSPTQVTTLAAAAVTPWVGDVTGTRAGRILDAADWPTADRDIDAGLSVLQATGLQTSALEALQKVEATEQGLLFINAAGQVRFVGRTELSSAPYTTSQATFGDSGAELPYRDIQYTYNDELIYNEITVTRVGGIPQTVSDATSQTAYLRRAQVLDGLLNDSDSASRDLANYRLAIYKDPLDRLTGLTVAPEKAPATLYPQVLGREIGDRLTVKRRPQGVGSAISQDANIEGITHSITPDAWVTSWNLTPANTLQFWLAGVTGASEAGISTVAGY